MLDCWAKSLLHCGPVANQSTSPTGSGKVYRWSLANRHFSVCYTVGVKMRKWWLRVRDACDTRIYTRFMWWQIMTQKNKNVPAALQHPLPFPSSLFLFFFFFFFQAKTLSKRKKEKKYAKNKQKINKKDFGIWGLVFCCARVHVWCLWLIKARMCVCVYMFTPELIIWLLSRSEAHVKLCPGSGSEKAQFSAVVVRL